MKRIREQISDPSATKYLGFAKSKLAGLGRSRELLRQPGFPPPPPMQEYYYIDGWLILVKAGEDEDTIRITGGMGGFYIHPRVATSPDAGVDFPLFDDDHGTQIIRVSTDGKDNVSLVKKPFGENYGNRHWSGWAETYSWRANPGVCLEMDASTEVGGLTSIEDFSDAKTSYRNTPFGQTVYRLGYAAVVAPEWGIIKPKVLCAGRDVLKRLVILLGTNYDNTINPQGEEGGYFDELITKVEGGWNRLHLRKSSRHVLTAHMSEDGGTIVSQFGTYTITEDAVTFVEHDNELFGSKVYDASGWGVTISAGRNSAYHLNGHLRLALTGTDTSTFANSSITHKSDSVPVYARVDYTDLGWTTVDTEETTCPYTPVGSAYRYNGDGTRHIVTWAVSQIPEGISIYPMSIIESNVALVQDWPCADKYCYVGAWNINMWFATPYGIQKCLYAGGWMEEWVARPNGETWSDSMHVNRYMLDAPSNPWKREGPHGPLCDKPRTNIISMAFAPNPICNDWLSDSYKSDLVDIYGNPVEVPEADGGFVIKVAKVVTQTCP